MTPTIPITVRLFGGLRMAVGASVLDRTVPAGATAGEVACSLLEEHDLSSWAPSVVCAVNAEYVDPSTQLASGDFLSLIPPVSGGAPRVLVKVTEEPLDVGSITASVTAPSVGATVVFQGTPRDVDALTFEVEPELANAELRRIGGELGEEFGLEAIALHHRFGAVPAEQAAIVIAAAAPRRAAAFAATEAALEAVKRRVPLWKSEVTQGSVEPVGGEVVDRVPTLQQAGRQAQLTHVDASGTARMVDVGDKPISDRVARAEGWVEVQRETAALVVEGNGPKGDVITTARLAGVMAAKRTAELVPLAHPLALSRVDVDIQVDAPGGRVWVRSHVRTSGLTGVEIEALTAVLVGALTVYDMIKAVDRHAQIGGVRVTQKRGGRHDFGAAGAGIPEAHAPAPRRLRVAAVHISTSRSRGVRPDRSRAALAATSQRVGWEVVTEQQVSDDRAQIAEAIRAAAVHPDVDVVLTLGGTGLTADDVTPEATRDVLEREVQGLAEALRAVSAQHAPMASLSRAVAGVLGRVLVVNLPGNPKALGELESLLSTVFPHAVDQIRRDDSA